MNLPGLQEMLRQAQQLQQRLGQLKSDLAQRTVSTSTGGGMVEVTADGTGRIVRIEIEPEILVASDREMLQDLLVAGVNSAREAAQRMAREAIQEIAGGLPIAGMDNLLGSF
ncbi:MAG: YbaB/EbfC family nucleoid-associated protein [Deltaproteobacteria bacterium]|nr:YbaB/EbfC family nucleoid-associated protein [Deltaproteobacteria bacterium]